MTGQGKLQMDEMLEQYMSRVQELLGNAFRYATACGLMREEGEDIRYVEVTIYTAGQLPCPSAKGAVEALALDMGKRYGIRLSVNFQEDCKEKILDTHPAL